MRGTSVIASNKGLVEVVQVGDEEKPEKSHRGRYWVQEQRRAGDAHGCRYRQGDEVGHLRVDFDAVQEIRGSRYNNTHVQVIDGFAVRFQLKHIVGRESDPEDLLDARNTKYARYNKGIVNMKKASDGV